MTCKNCIHYGICEYSTIADKEVDCKDFISNTIKAETVRRMQERLKNYLREVADGDIGYGWIDQIAEEMLEEDNV